MADRVIQRHDTAARWQSINPILATGEIGIEIDGAKGYKIGDGKTRWNDLPYPANPSSVVQETGNSNTAVMSQKVTTEKLAELGQKVDGVVSFSTPNNSAVLAFHNVLNGKKVYVRYRSNVKVLAFNILNGSSNLYRAIDNYTYMDLSDVDEFRVYLQTEEAGIVYMEYVELSTLYSLFEQKLSITDKMYSNLDNLYPITEFQENLMLEYSGAESYKSIQFKMPLPINDLAIRIIGEVSDDSALWVNYEENGKNNNRIVANIESGIFDVSFKDLDFLYNKTISNLRLTIQSLNIVSYYKLNVKEIYANDVIALAYHLNTQVEKVKSNSEIINGLTTLSTDYGYIDTNGVLSKVGDETTSCRYVDYVEVTKGDVIEYHGGYFKGQFSPLWGYADNKGSKPVPIGEGFTGEEQTFRVKIESEDIKYVRAFGLTSFNPYVKNIGLVERVNDYKNYYDIVVAQDGSGDYTSLYDAIQETYNLDRNRHITIFVKPGNYEMPVYDGSDYHSNRNISIIGADKNRVIVYNNNGVYTNMSNDSTPIRLSGNVTIENLTIKSKSIDYVGDGTPTSYCVHVDFDAENDSVMEIVNCDMYNDHYACIGVGLRAGFTLRIKNCTLYSKSHEHFQAQLWNGAIICHDGRVSGDCQRIEIIKNIIECTGDKCISLLPAYNNEINATLIGNAIFSATDNPLVIGSKVVINSRTCNNNIPITN